MASKNTNKNLYEGVSEPRWVKKAGQFVVTEVTGNSQKQTWFRNEEEAWTYRNNLK